MVEDRVCTSRARGRWRRRRCALRLLAPALAWLAAASTPAGAALITNAVIVDNSTVNPGLADPNQYYANTSATPTIACGAMCTSFEVQFAGAAGVEVGNTETATVTFSWAYQVSFEVDAFAGEQWEITIDTSLLGALTLVDDSFILGSATASLGDVTGSYSGPGTVVSGSLDLPGFGTLSGFTGGNQPFDAGDRSSLMVVRGSGPATGASAVQLTFSMNGQVESASSCFLFFCNADEAAVRLGDVGTLAGFSAGDYPGPDGRVQGLDGHWLVVGIAAVPEPRTALLVVLGLLGLAAARRPR